MISQTIANQYPWLSYLIESSPDTVDLTNQMQSIQLEETVKMLLDQSLSMSDIDAIEAELLSSGGTSYVFELLAMKVLRSKLIVSSIDSDLQVSVVFAVYKENIRIQKNSEHPHGEDFLRRKVAQLSWLFNKSPNIRWQMSVVDDGCPEGTGKMAQSIIDQEGWENVEVLYLQDAIDKKLGPAAMLASTSDSQKGGSIEYGMWNAAQKSDGDHIIVYTDADLSTHLGQTGLLLDPIINRNKDVAIGSRRELNSVVLKKSTRNNRGKLFIYLWKRMLPVLGEMIDTQCGFKAFRTTTIRQIIDDMVEQKFAFDIELLLKAELLKPGSIEKVGVAWIDSEAASTTTDIQPYLSMLKSIVAMYRKYLPSNSSSDEFGKLIEGLTQEDFDIILENIPEGITSRQPYEYNDYSEIGAEDLQAIIGA